MKPRGFFKVRLHQLVLLYGTKHVSSPSTNSVELEISEDSALLDFFIGEDADNNDDVLVNTSFGVSAECSFMLGGKLTVETSGKKSRDIGDVGVLGINLASSTEKG